MIENNIKYVYHFLYHFLPSETWRRMEKKNRRERGKQRQSSGENEASKEMQKESMTTVGVGGGRRRRRIHLCMCEKRKKWEEEGVICKWLVQEWISFVSISSCETQTEGCHHGYQPMAILQSFHPSQQQPMTSVAKLWYFFWTLFDCYGASGKNISQFDLKGLVDDLKKTTGEMQAMFAASNNNNGNVLFFGAYLWRTQ